MAKVISKVVNVSALQMVLENTIHPAAALEAVQQMKELQTWRKLPNKVQQVEASRSAPSLVQHGGFIEDREGRQQTRWKMFWRGASAGNYGEAMRP